MEARTFRTPILGRLRFACTPMALIDLAAFAPAYLGLDARFIRILRLLKLSRYIRAMQVFQRVLIRKRMELMVTLIIILILPFSLSHLPPQSGSSDQQPTDADPATDTAAAPTVHAQADTDADATPSGSAQVGTIRA